MFFIPRGSLPESSNACDAILAAFEGDLLNLADRMAKLLVPANPTKITAERGGSGKSGPSMELRERRNALQCDVGKAYKLDAGDKIPRLLVCSSLRDH